MKNQKARALEREADKLLKAYSTLEKWKSNRKNKSYDEIIPRKKKTDKNKSV